MAAWWKVVFWVRVLSVCLFLVVSLKFSLYTLVSFCLVLSESSYTRSSCTVYHGETH